jgi:hypothetical protein
MKSYNECECECEREREREREWKWNGMHLTVRIWHFVFQSSSDILPMRWNGMRWNGMYMEWAWNLSSDGGGGTRQYN